MDSRFKKAMLFYGADQSAREMKVKEITGQYQAHEWLVIDAERLTDKNYRNNYLLQMKQQS